MRKVAFLARGFDEFNQFAVQDKKIYSKIVALIKDIQRDPFSGLGKPEALKSTSYRDCGQDVLQKSIAWFIG